jgi:hypothetical protein
MNINGITRPNMRLYDHGREQAVQVSINTASGDGQHTCRPQEPHDGMNLIQPRQISVFVHFPSGCISQCWQCGMNLAVML